MRGNEKVDELAIKALKKGDAELASKFNLGKSQPNVARKVAWRGEREASIPDVYEEMNTGESKQC